ncbi:MAG: SPOR domain-containing protein [Hydrogenophilales bacterium]|nr:SPOR domain-containing protein [Hydrogenophilales bacterium]
MAQEQNADDSGAIRKKAVTRLIAAAVVTATALGALWWLDNSGNKTRLAVAKTPSPIVAAPSTPQPPLPEPAVSPGKEATPAQVEPPPPPEISAPTTAPALARTPATSTGTAAAPTLAASTATRPAARISPPVPAPPAKVEMPKAYVVQLGVFADPANARDLVDRLVKVGVRAQMETRVQLGPFANRQEAEKARAELMRLGVKGVVATK